MYERPLWGISTGLAFKGLPIDQAAEIAHTVGAEVVELCPNNERPTGDQINKLRGMADKGLIYTVHMTDPFRTNNPNAVELFRERNQVALDLAHEIKARNVVHHPPITRYASGVLTDEEYSAFMNELYSYQLPVYVETGVFRRNHKDEAIEFETARHPMDVVKFLRGNVTGIVGDVPKMSRFREYPDEGRRFSGDVRDYMDECKRWGVPMKEMHIIGTEKWDRDAEFAQYALEQARDQQMKPEVIMIESTYDRLSTIMGVVRRQVYDWNNPVS